MAALGASLSGLEVIGGPVAFLVAVTLSCSLGMALPISTPPNALAHATGTIKTSQMTQVGLIMAVFGFGIIMGLIFLLKQIQFFG